MRSLLQTCSLAAVLFSLTALPCLAQEWTRFRGPNGLGVSETTTIPITWTDEDYNWRSKLPGVGHSSPVIWGKRLFLTSGDPKTGERIVLCFDTENGNQLWERRFSAATHPMHQRNSYASSSPVVDADRVYVTWATPDKFEVKAFDHEGKDAWSIDLGAFPAHHGFGGSPTLVDDLIVVPSDHKRAGFLVALDRATGEERWRKQRGLGKASYSTPSVHQLEDGKSMVIFTNTANGMTAVDAQTGDTLWEATDVFPERCVGSPLIVDGLVWASSGSGNNGREMVAVRIDPELDSDSEERVAIRMKKSSPYVPTPVAYHGMIFFWHDQGYVICADAKTGKQIWKKRIGGAFSGSPVCVAGRLYCVSHDGEVVVLAAEDKFKELGRSQLNDLARATPAVANGKMFLRTASELFCVGGEK